MWLPRSRSGKTACLDSKELPAREITHIVLFEQTVPGRMGELSARPYFAILGLAGCELRIRTGCVETAVMNKNCLRGDSCDE